LSSFDFLNQEVYFDCFQKYNVMICIGITMMRMIARSNSLHLVRVEVVEKDWRGQGRCLEMRLICDESILDLTCLLILVAHRWRGRDWECFASQYL